MKEKVTDVILVLMAVVSFFLSIHSSSRAGATIDGAALYSSHCAKCHGPVLAKPGISTVRIETAIASVSAMKSLSVLSISEIQAIAMASNATSAASASLPTSIYGTTCAPSLELSSAGRSGRQPASSQHGT